MTQRRCCDKEDTSSGTFSGSSCVWRRGVEVVLDIKGQIRYVPVICASKPASEYLFSGHSLMNSSDPERNSQATVFLGVVEYR